MTNFSNADVLGKRVKNLGKRKYRMKKLIVTMFSLLVVSALGQSVRIYPSSGPHRFGAASAYYANVVSALQAGQVVAGDWTANPSGYAVFSSLKPIDFRSASTSWAMNIWRGQLSPPAPFSGEKGNSLWYTLIVESPTKFSLSSGSFTSSSGDPLNILARTVSFATRNYSSAWVGIDFGPDGVEGGGDDIVYNSGESGTLPVDKIYGVGEWQTLSSSSQDSWNNNLDYNIPWLKGSYSFAGGTITGEITIPVLDDYGLDFGDLPDSSGTLLSTDGARHTIMPGIHFGRYVDAETDGIPSVNANGDDVAGVVPDDEDGWFFPNVYRGQTVTFTNWVTDFTGAAKVWGWVDWNGDGDFGDSGEQVLSGFNPPNHNGENTFSLSVPAGAFLGKVGARFRITTDDEITFDGPTLNGEVEDYLVEVKSPPPTAAILVRFSAEKKPMGEEVEVRWGIGVEAQILGYYVERLIGDSKTWERVSTLVLPLGDGAPKSYHITDFTRSSVVEYRIIALDLRGAESVLGQTTMSVATTLSVAMAVQITVWGTPDDLLVVEGSSDLVFWIPISSLRLNAEGKGVFIHIPDSSIRFYRTKR